MMRVHPTISEVSPRSAISEAELKIVHAFCQRKLTRRHLHSSSFSVPPWPPGVLQYINKYRRHKKVATYKKNVRKETQRQKEKKNTQNKKTKGKENKKTTKTKKKHRKKTRKKKKKNTKKQNQKKKQKQSET